MKASKLWLLIADGGRARVLSNSGPGRGVVAVPGLVFSADLPLSHDIGADRPGRTFDSTGKTRHAMEPHSDPHQQLKHKFVVGLVEMLEENLEQGEFDRLVIAAPPSVLGMMRPAISNRLDSVIAAEVDKDLTKVPDHEVAAHLADLIIL